MSFGLLFFAVFCAVGIGCLVLGIKLACALFDIISLIARNSIHRLFPPPPPPPKSFGSGSTVAAIVWSLLPSTAVLAVFVGLSGAANREWNKIIVLNLSPPPPVVVNRPDLTIEQNVSFQKKLDDKSNVLPEWIKTGDLSEGDIHRFVLSSRLWSTEAEAVQDLQNQAAERIRADFLQRHPGLLDPKNFDADGIVKSMLKQSYVEQIEQDFGKFTAPMFRAWWQIEISPIVRTELYPQWKSASTQNRTIVVGIILALLTLLASSVELFAKFQPQAQRTAFKFFALGAVPLVYSAVELLVAARLIS